LINFFNNKKKTQKKLKNNYKKLKTHFLLNKPTNIVRKRIADQVPVTQILIQIRHVLPMSSFNISRVISKLLASLSGHYVPLAIGDSVYELMMAMGPSKRVKLKIKAKTSSCSS
jgi:hypothetical protein